MASPLENDPFIDQFVAWAEQRPDVRVVLITSTRAIPSTVPGAAFDQFSDYDIELVVEDVRPFHASRDWLAAFGRVLVLYRDPVETEFGADKTGYVIQFEGGLKIDFILWQVEAMKNMASAPELPAEFDAGYVVLLDKDGLTAGLKPPTYQAYIPKPPSETEYREFIEQALLEAIYVAKYLWRGDVIAAKYVRDHYLLHEHLRPMLEWHLETERGWAMPVKVYGRGLHKHLRPDLMQDLLGTFCGAGLEENWAALYRTVGLLRKTGLELSERLGYPYPHEMDRGTLAYLREIQATPRENL